MATSEEIFNQAMALAPEVRAKLAEQLIGGLAEDVSPEITNTQLAEVRRRIEQVESGEIALIPGDDVLARVRSLLAQHLPPR
jgi:putative addiction module component (TIGR02574 family)